MAPEPGRDPTDEDRTRTSADGHGLIGMKERVPRCSADVLRGRARSRTAATWSRRASRWSSPPVAPPPVAPPRTAANRRSVAGEYSGSDRRRPGARSQRLPHDPRSPSDDLEVVGEEDRERPLRRSSLARRAGARRRADGRTHARAWMESKRRGACSSRARATRVIILTTFDLDEYVFEALRAGASGFLLKDVPAEHSWTEAIRVAGLGRGVAGALGHAPACSISFAASLDASMKKAATRARLR